MLKTLKQISNISARRFIGPFWYYRNFLNKSQWFTKEELELLQLSCLQKIVRNAEKNVPYYKNVMKINGFTSGDIQSLNDIRLFPILTKHDVLNAGNSMTSNKWPKQLLNHAYTGGTTGTPLNIFRSPWSIGVEHAFVRRQWNWAGINLTDKCAYLTGRLVADVNEDLNFHSYDPFMKELILSTYHLNESRASNYIDLIRRYKCKAIVGYPSAIRFLAQVYSKHKSDELQIKSVLTSSETLTSSAKELIEQSFQCKVYDFYGSAERVCYVFTCEHGNYHIQPEYGYTELIPVNSDNPNRCKVVATGFWNFAMPFIRYELGDIVNLAEEQNCKCGRRFPIIKNIEGRPADIIRTPSGREFGAAILTHLLYGTNNILESQIIQNSLGNIRIDYVPNINFSEKDLNDFKDLIRKHLPIDELKVSFNQVEKVERTSSGKIRPVISRIDSE